MLLAEVEGVDRRGIPALGDQPVVYVLLYPVLVQEVRHEERHGKQAENRM